MAEKKKSKKKSDKDSYTSRNEFKEGFYDQPDKPPITPETYYGTASGKTMFDADMTSPDDSMLMEYKQKGGSVTVKTKLGKNKATKLY